MIYKIILIIPIEYITYKYPKSYIKINKKFLRPEELSHLKGDSTKIRSELGWKPNYTFETMLDDMIEARLELYK